MKMMMQNSAHILCRNEADAFLSPQDEKSRELIKTFIRFGYKASLSSNGHPDQLHALSAADLPQEWNYWQDTFTQRVTIGEPHSGYSDVSSEPRKIALILNTTFRPRTAWQLRGHPCSPTPRSPSRTTVQGHGRNKEIVVLHIEQSDEYRGMLPKSSNKSFLEIDSRHVTRADLPFATIGVFHIHPSISHGAAREDFQNEIMPLVTLYQCDAITGDANKSANTYSRLQHVFNPANGLMNVLMKAYQRLWNETENLPLVDRMEYAMETSCALKSIVRHHLYMKAGSGYDRTFPDVMMTFVFGWGKTNIQQVFRKEEMNAMKDEQLEAMRNDPTSAIFDYQVSSAERFKHLNNDMFMNGSQDSDSHSPLMVYIRSRSAARQRNFERFKEHLKKKQPWTQQDDKEYNKQYWGNPKQSKDDGDSTWNDYGDYVSQSDSSRRWYR